MTFLISLALTLLILLGFRVFLVVLYQKTQDMRLDKLEKQIAKLQGNDLHD